MKEKDTASLHVGLQISVKYEPFNTEKQMLGALSSKIMPDSNHFTFSYTTVTLKQGGAVYSELRTICFSNFSAIPAVHHCHKLIIDQRMMRLMFTVSCLLLYPHHSYVSFAQWYGRHQNCKIKQDLQVWFPVTITTLVLSYWVNSSSNICIHGYLWEGTDKWFSFNSSTSKRQTKKVIVSWLFSIVDELLNGSAG